MRLLPLFLLLISCGHMPAGRSFLSEMTREDRGAFEPYTDFPVVAGDSGEWGYSEEVRRLRTPASESEGEEYELEHALASELSELEAKQSPEAFARYQKYAHHFETISERIYFLKLPYHDRYSYLESRGLIETKYDGAFTFETNGRLNRGMSKTQVLTTLGQPQRIEIAGNPRFENERWLYAEQGSPKYIYFESGLVGGWE